MLTKEETIDGILYEKNKQYIYDKKIYYLWINRLMFRGFMNWCTIG